MGGNARYRSHAIIGEFLQVVAAVIEEQQLSSMRNSRFYSLLTDESTDIAVKKQLVLVARCEASGKVTTSYINVQDISDRTADTIVQTLLSYLSKSL